MTPEELLKPRYKVIADYPAQHYSIGDVIDTDNPQLCSVCEDEFWLFNLGKYPHLFKPLQWWEERKESDMPQYVKGLKSVRKILQIEDHGSWAPSILVEGETIWSPIWLYEPATEQEYLKNKS